MTTHAEYIAAARKIVRDYVRADRQWDVATLESYLPEGRVLRGDASPYHGPATAADIAVWMRRESTEGQP